VIPLEVWDLMSDDGPLCELSEHPCFVRALLEVLEALHRGEAQSLLQPRGGLAVARGYAGLVVVGGGLLRPGVVGALLRRYYKSDYPRLLLPQSPVFMVEDGGRALAEGRGNCPLIVDVGQTAVKLMFAERRGLVRRDWQALPAVDSRAKLLPSQRGVQRQLLRSFVAGAVRSFLQREPGIRPDVVVLGLPCELDDLGVPGPCSYAGLEHDGEFAAAVLAEAGLAEVPCLILNDAELAAVSARARWAELLPPRTLVLTLGFGVGAALLP
jgi:hypothetical protein